MNNEERDNAAEAMDALRKEIERLAATSGFATTMQNGLPPVGSASLKKDWESRETRTASNSDAASLWRSVLPADLTSAQSTGGHFLRSVFPVIGRIFSFFGSGGDSAPETKTWKAVELPRRAAEFGFAGAGDWTVSETDHDADGKRRLVRSSEAQAGSRPIEIRVEAVDSQSFMDRKQDIAEAVRLALLENHRLSDVVSEY